MKTFNSYLKENLKNPDFKEGYEAEKKKLDIALQIHSSSEELGLSQKELANKSHITQQQLSKIENGINCNIDTLLKVCDALNLDIFLKKRTIERV